MAQITSYPFIRHLRAEAASHIRCVKKGETTHSGRGLSFWFDATVASISEVPLADRELPFMVHSKTADYQDLAVNGAILWRVADPALLTERVDFTIDLVTGEHTEKPEDQIRSTLTGQVREFSDTYLKVLGVRAALDAGLAPLQEAIRMGFAADPTLEQMGLQVIAVRVAALAPSSELMRALQAPTFESLQQKADEATFARRALAVEKERAIAENELANQIELAARRAELIATEDANARAEAEAQAAASRIRAEADAEAKVTAAQAEAKRIHAAEQAAADVQTSMMQAVGQVAPEALFALAARDVATKLERIDSITITPETLAGLVSQVRALAAPAAKG